MRFSVSCRIAEGFLSKEEACMSFEELADLAVAAGYDAICMRASQIGVQSAPDAVRDAKRILEDRALGVSMITGDFDIVYNNDRGPTCLRNIVPYLDLAETLGASLIRVCIKQPDDIAFARIAADMAAKRGLKLVHQCHNQSLFETLDEIASRLREIDRPNFGLIFEAANLELSAQDYGPEAIERLAPWIENVYLQNQRLNSNGAITLDTWNRGPVSFDVTQIHDPGGIDFPSVFAGLQKIGYDGTVTVHQSAPEDAETSPLDAATQTAQFLRQIMST
jgi:sugar phosphate isomerase/epimerase